MKNLTEHLSQYARYHRDERNILTHYAGIPLILVAVFALLYWPLFTLAGVAITPALLLFIGGMAFYLRLDLRFALVMFGFTGLCLLLVARSILTLRPDFPFPETPRRSVPAARLDAPGPTISGPRPLPWGLGCFDRVCLKE